MTRTHNALIVASAFVLFALATSAPAQAALVGYYNFDGLNAADLSGNGNNGALGTGKTFVSDSPFSGAALSNTSGSFVTAANSVSLQTIDDQLTLSFWLKADPNANAIWYRMFRKGNESGSTETFMVNRNGASIETGMRFDTFGPGGAFNQNRGTGAGDVLDNTWHHVAYRVENGSFREYVDGMLTVTTTYSHGNGLFNTNALEMFGGISLYDDFGVWSSALSDGQILSIYNFANTPELNFNLGTVMQLFELGVGDTTSIGDRNWVGVSGLATPVGQVIFDGDIYFMNFGGGLGVAGLLPAPEPASATLLGLGAVLLVRRTRKSLRDGQSAE